MIGTTKNQSQVKLSQGPSQRTSEPRTSELRPLSYWRRVLTFSQLKNGNLLIDKIRKAYIIWIFRKIYYIVYIEHL